MAQKTAPADGKYTMTVGKETGHFLVKKGGRIPDGAKFVVTEVPDAHPNKFPETPEDAPPVIDTPEGGPKPQGVESPEGGLHVVDEQPANDTVTIGTPNASTAGPIDGSATDAKDVSTGPDKGVQAPSETSKEQKAAKDK